MFSAPNKKHLLLGLLFVAIICAGVALKYFNTFAPKPLVSSADQELPHWAHTSIPFEMTLVNYAGASWENTLVSSESRWENSGAYTYTHSTKFDPNFQCYPIVLPLQKGMNVCAINEENDWLALSGYGTGPEDPVHLVGGIIILNNYYLNRIGSSYNTQVWRNFLACRFLGWTMGAPYRDESIDNVSSCMNIPPNDIMSPKTMQFPDNTDISYMKELYDHIDTESKPPSKSPQKTLSTALESGNLGPVTQILAGGKIELHELSLGDGYIFHSMIQKK